jgi:hypothetical protein
VRSAKELEKSAGLKPGTYRGGEKDGGLKPGTYGGGEKDGRLKPAATWAQDPLPPGVFS